METKCGEASTQSCLFPLRQYRASDEFQFEEEEYTSNLRREHLPSLFQCKDVSDREIFNWIYAQFYAHSYRQRYADFFKLDFPRVFFTSSPEFFEELEQMGNELVALHLLESSTFTKRTTTFLGSGDFQVEKVSYSDETVWLDKAQTRGFKGVPEEVWNFQIGGYQVCNKWLKDRQAKGGKNPRPGRVLTKNDIDHYQKIVVALSETIRIMAEIDKVIEKHGGWPGAFVTDDKAAKA